jgi:hypothetical protein
MDFPRLAIRRDIGDQILLIGSTSAEEHRYVIKIVATAPADVQRPAVERWRDEVASRTSW